MGQGRAKLDDLRLPFYEISPQNRNLQRNIRLFAPLSSQALIQLAGAAGGVTMGRGILLWLLGVPIPVIILLALIWH